MHACLLTSLTHGTGDEQGSDRRRRAKLITTTGNLHDSLHATQIASYVPQFDDPAPLTCETVHSELANFQEANTAS